MSPPPRLLRRFILTTEDTETTEGSRERLGCVVIETHFVE